MADPNAPMQTFGVDGSLRTDPYQQALAANRALNPIRKRREMLLADVNMLTSDPAKLGISNAQRNQLTGEATRAAGAQRQSQVSQLGQQALAGQGFQEGAFQQAQQQAVEGAASDAATASANVSALSEQKANAEANRIRGAVDLAAERKKADMQFWTQFGLDAASQVISASVGIGG